MSAFVLSKHHIDALVTGIIKHNVLTCRHADCAEVLPLSGACSASRATELGKLLWRENVRSVNHRYQGRRERAGRYVYARHELDPVALHKVLSCYGYQSSEHPGWLKSRACQYVTVVENILESRGITHESPGYDRAPWGIDGPPSATPLNTQPTTSV